MRRNFANVRFEVDETHKIMSRRKEPNYKDFDMF